LGNDKGLSSFLDEYNLEIEYDPNIGENYIKEKDIRIDKNSSPKMFYIPDEIAKNHRGLEYIQLMFSTSSITQLELSRGSINETQGIRMFKLTYKKLI